MVLNAIQPFQSLQDKFIVTAILKHDVKGDVLKAIFFKGFLRPRFCVIKQGRSGKSKDELGRDMTARIAWQYHIHQDLYPSVNIPAPQDYFIKNHDHFMVTEHINGKTLEALISEIRQGRDWLDMPLQAKHQTLTLLLQVVETVDAIHCRGYVHRDLNHVNFLVRPCGKIYLIDWELAYNINAAYPLPPFGLGTQGFMSPEQMRRQKPSIGEDVYALGALLIFFLTGLPPLKFDMKNIGRLKHTLQFLTGETGLCELACQCLTAKSEERPAVGAFKCIVQREIANLAADDQTKSIFHQATVPRQEEINALIINSNKAFMPLNAKKTALLSPLGEFEARLGERQIQGVSMGLRSPITAIMLVFLNQKEVDTETKAYFKTFFEEEQAIILQTLSNNGVGLLNGTAAQALCLYAAYKMDMLPPAYPTVKLILQCFERPSQHLNIAEGLSGQLWALSQIDDKDQFPDLDKKFSAFTLLILEAQQKNGSWILESEGTRKNYIPLGLQDGLAGILIALISAYQTSHSEEVLCAIQAGFGYIQKKLSKKLLGGYTKYAPATYQRTLALGKPGLALAFLYGFELTGNELWATVARKLLQSLGHDEVDQDFSLATGMAGRGFVYAEAFRILKDRDWLTKAAWIYQVFAQTVHYDAKDAARWRVSPLYEYDIGLLAGSAGIVFFLQKLSEVIKLN